jgi:anti-sigma factor RsiW
VACAEPLRVQAYFDGELDALASLEVEHHLESCAECRGLLNELQQLRVAIRTDLAPQVTPRLRDRVARALDTEESLAATPARSPRRVSSRGRAFWLGAFSGLAGSAIAATLLFLLLSPTLGNGLVDDVLSAHVRSLMPSHLIDVESSDHHTVKPWFSGHADVSPVVEDFTSQGFRLIGGRADYLDHQRAAVVVYEHGAHVINVFSWEAKRGGIRKESSRNGYHMIFWTSGDLQYCAVSDAAWDELRSLARLLQERAQRDYPPSG